MKTLKVVRLPVVILLAILVTSLLYFTQPGLSASATPKRVCRNSTSGYPAYPGVSSYPAGTPVWCAFIPMAANQKPATPTPYGMKTATPTRTSTPTRTPTPTPTNTPTVRAYP